MFSHCESNNLQCYSYRCGKTIEWSFEPEYICIKLKHCNGGYKNTDYLFVYINTNCGFNEQVILYKSIVLFILKYLYMNNMISIFVAGIIACAINLCKLMKTIIGKLKEDVEREVFEVYTEYILFPQFPLLTL